MVKVRLRHGSRALWIESIVDSGSHCCIFDSEIARYLGIDLRQGKADRIRGVMASEWSDVRYHDLTLELGTSAFSVMAGFASQPSTPGILGWLGSFENFHVVFDPLGLALEINEVT